MAPILYELGRFGVTVRVFGCALMLGRGLGGPTPLPHPLREKDRILNKIVALAGLAGVAATGLLAAPATAAGQSGPPGLESVCAPVRDIIAHVEGVTANVN